MLRLWVVISVVWMAAMGWYQFSDRKAADENSLIISLDKETEFRIDASGIKQQDKSEVQMQRIGWIVLPPLALLAAAGAGVWLARGFKKEGQV